MAPFGLSLPDASPDGAAGANVAGRRPTATPFAVRDPVHAVGGAARGGPDVAAIGSAVAAGLVGGAAAAGRFGSAVLRVAAWTDRRLAGRRVGVVVVLAASVVVAPLLDQAFESVWLAPTSLAVFAVAVFALVFARVDAFRDTSGWRWSLVARTIGEARDAARVWFARLAKESAGQRAIDIAKVFLVLCTFGGALSNIAAMVGASDLGSDIAITSFVALPIAGALWLWGRARRKRDGQTSGAGLDAPSAKLAALVVQGLPEVVDCRDTTGVLAAADRAGHPLVAALLRELSGWRPRAYYDDEREYQEKLLNVLRTKLPEARPQAEQWIGESERIDLRLGDEKSGVLIEMKAHANNAAVDRLVGQASKYLRVWRGRGPLIIVLCRTTDARVPERIALEVRALREQGHAIMAVLAAP